MKTVTVNGRNYNWPAAPLVVICCDGSEPDYMEVAMRAGLMPNLQRIIAKGSNLRGHSVIPASPIPTTCRSSPAGHRPFMASAAITLSIQPRAWKR